MSIELVVYLRRSAMPPPVGWGQAIRDAGFPVEPDADFDPDTSTGFRPCSLQGVPSGFEYFAARLSGPGDDAPPGADFRVSLVTHSDLREFACAVAAAGTLARASDGLLVDPQSGESFGAAEAVPWATEQFAEAVGG